VTSDFDHPVTSDEVDNDGLPAPATPMRRSPRIGQADVFQAADGLLLEGNRPTIDRVRVRLGRGSPNTINEHLDAWWLKLGARLRDVPGREFPQLPERTAQALLTLWNEALAGAQDTLRGSIGARESERLEAALADPDSETIRLRARIESAEALAESFREKHHAVLTAHETERLRLEERHQSAESRWITEVDRVRQNAKEQERHIKDVQRQVTQLAAERDTLRQEIQGTHAELKTANAVREQLELRLRAAHALELPPQATRMRKKSVSKRAKKGRSLQCQDA
jgi:hypothetical protein